MFEKEIHKRKELEPNEIQILIKDIPLISKQKSARTSSTEIPLFSHKAYCIKNLFYAKKVLFPQLRAHARRTQKVIIPS